MELVLPVSTKVRDCSFIKSGKSIGVFDLNLIAVHICMCTEISSGGVIKRSHDLVRTQALSPLVVL